MTDEFDLLFKGTTGLFDDGEVTFTEVRFIKDPGYTNSDGDLMPVFAADLKTDDPSVGESGVLENQFFSIGKGWEITDGGAAIERADGKPKGFNVSTYLQSFLNALMEIDLDAVKNRYETVGSGPQTAAFWEGLVVHVEQTEYETGGFKDVEKKTRSRLMPTAIIGWGAASAKAEAPKPAAKKASAKKAVAKPATVPDLTPYATAKTEVDADVVAAIRSIADEVATTDEFMERAYAEIDGIDTDENIQLLVDDTDSEDSIWADAVAAAS